MPIRACLYCEKQIVKAEFAELFREADPLCPQCRKGLRGKWRSCVVEGVKVHYLYEYGESLFKSMLLQFKEGGDEALKGVFLTGYRSFLTLRYSGYTLVAAPSTIQKRAARGFCHLQAVSEGIFSKRKEVGFREERTQQGRNRREREKMRNNFYALSSFSPHEKILLFDDVLTSGSTVLGMHNLLKNKVKKIDVFVLGIVK